MGERTLNVCKGHALVKIHAGGVAENESVDGFREVRYCMEHAEDGDIIVLAGKGHEDYQEIKGVKHHMDERELIADIIRENTDLKL